MQQKAHKTIGHVTPQRPMTDEEKQARIMQFLTQKRETFSINILSRLTMGMSYDILRDEVKTDEKIPKLVEVSVKMADALMEKLYPMPEEESKEETKEESDDDLVLK